MKMYKEWSSFRITLLLYAIVFIIPLTFYFVHTSFNEIDKDTKTIRQVGWLDGSVMSLAIEASEQNNHQMIKQVDETLQNISVWVTQNNDSKFYLGAQTLSKDLLNVTTCWDTYKQKLSTQYTEASIKKHHLNCMDSVKSLTLIIENMIYLKQKDFINIFYWKLAIVMIITVLLIYLIRAYILSQMKKHAIHDHATKLFNKKYFCAELKTSCARAERNNVPLSMLSIAIDGFEKESKRYDSKTREHILGMLGGLITTLTRTSDVACRYDENHFSILLPDTPEKNALILEGRIREAFEKHDFAVTPELQFNFVTAHLNDKESAETFLSRTEGLLK